MKERPSFPVRLDFLDDKSRLKRSTPQRNHGTPGPGAKVPGRVVVQGLGLDSSAVRLHMVDRLAAQGIVDHLVLSAMGSIERHRFVDTALVNQAYEETSLSLIHI